MTSPTTTDNGGQSDPCVFPAKAGDTKKQKQTHTQKKTETKTKTKKKHIYACLIQFEFENTKV